MCHVVYVLFESALRDETVVDYDANVTKLKHDLRESMEVAQQHATRQQSRQKQQFDKKVKGSPVSVGDRTLLANKAEWEKKKLADIWGHLEGSRAPYDEAQAEPSGFCTRAGRVVKAVDRFMCGLNMGTESFFPYKYEPQAKVGVI